MSVRFIFCCGPFLLMACNTGKVTLDRVTEDFDARFVSQVFTWGCQSSTEDETDLFVGTYGHEISLFFAPGKLDDLIPTDGCVYGVDMFPTSAGEGASSIEGLAGYPMWSNSVDNGVLEGGFGYWSQDVLTDEHTCENPSTVLTDAIELENALGLSSVQIEQAFDVPRVDFSEGISFLEFGQDASVEWETHEWPRSWVHIRRSKAGQPVEVLTCVTSDVQSFELDDVIWDQFDEGLSADTLDVYVAFEHRDVQRSDDGSIVEILNRAVAIPVED